MLHPDAGRRNFQPRGPMSAADGFIIGKTKLVDHGPDGVRWTLAILAEGYRAVEMGQFAADAQQVVNRLFAVRPFDELQGAINVYRVDVASNGSGADDPAACGGTGAAPATYFDASFCDGGIRRALVVDDDLALSVAAAQVPAVDVVLVLVNSMILGGTGGKVAVMSLSALEVAIHELGHILGLADEYEYEVGCGLETNRNFHPPEEPDAPNVTRETNKFFIEWRNLLTPGPSLFQTTNANCALCDPQPNPFPPGTVGAFEGADNYHCGAFRPEFDCRMRNVSTPFCAVCQQAIRNVFARYIIPGDVSGIPSMTWRSGLGRGTLDLITPLRTGGLGHYWRDNNAPGMPWRGPFVFGTNAGSFDSVSLMTAGDDLELVTISANQLLRYLRGPAPAFVWSGPFPAISPLVSGNPCLIRAIFNFKLTYLLVVPLASGGLAHFFRAPQDTSWSGPYIFATELGRIDAVGMIQSSFGDPGNGIMPTNLEVIVRVGGDLYHYWRDAGPAFRWSGPFRVGQSGVSGNPWLIQGPLGGGVKKNFELVVPLASGGLAHYWRQNDAPGLPWHGPIVFGTDIGQFSAVTGVFDTYTLQLVPPHTLQIAARFQNGLLYYYRDAGPLFRWTLL